MLRQLLVGQALQAVSEGRRVFAYPISAQVLALVYDPALFGYPPRSIEELLSTRFGPGVLPFALDLTDPAALAPLVGSLQGTLTDADGNLLWRPATVAEVLRRLAPAWESAAGWRACRGSDLESLQVQLFAQGHLASFIAGPWLLQALEDSGRPFAVMPVPPLGPGAAPGRALVGYQCVVVSRESRWGDIALDVGARLLQEATNERINRATRRLPVLLRAYESKQGLTGPGSFGFLRALEQGQFVPATESWSEGFEQARRQLESFASRTRPPAPGDVAALLAGEPAVKLRWQLVVSHLVSILTAALLIGAVHIFLLLRSTRVLEQQSLDASLATASHLLAQKVNELEDDRDAMAALRRSDALHPGRRTSRPPPRPPRASTVSNASRSSTGCSGKPRHTAGREASEAVWRRRGFPATPASPQRSRPGATRHGSTAGRTAGRR